VNDERTAGPGTFKHGRAEGSAMNGDDGPNPSPIDRLRDALHEFWTTRNGPVMVLRELLVSVTTVALIGLLLFSLAGVWPPMVAVESGSMEPNMHKGDLVFVAEPGRYVPGEAATEGVVTLETGEEVQYRSFGDYGSVVIYERLYAGSPVIHRAHFYVEEGENWYDEANESYISATHCGETPDEGLPNCPAPNAGFITKGDNNPSYDQVMGIAREPVPRSRIIGTAQVRVPYLGYVRLWLSGKA
jgi:signal peptidase